MIDPTRDEMAAFLLEEFGPEDLEIAEAIYWFAADWHSGQSSNLYSAVSTSQFIPGLSVNGPSDGLARDMYEALEAKFASK